MKAVCLAALLIAILAPAHAGPPPASIKLPTMEDPPAPAPASPKSLVKRHKRALPASMPYIVMYGSPTCPYCAQARAYMAARGIPYEERDVDHSRTAKSEFRGLGGSGVPLFVIGDELIRGFNANALDAAIWRAAR